MKNGLVERVNTCESKSPSRFGLKGVAVNLVSDRDRHHLDSIQRLSGNKGFQHSLPSKFDSNVPVQLDISFRCSRYKWNVLSLAVSFYKCSMTKLSGDYEVCIWIVSTITCIEIVFVFNKAFSSQVAFVAAWEEMEALLKGLRWAGQFCRIRR